MLRNPSDLKGVLCKGQDLKVSGRLERFPGQDQDRMRNPEMYQLRRKYSGNHPWKERDQSQTVSEVSFEARKFDVG